VSDLTDLHPPGLPGAIYGSFARGGDPRDVGPLTDLHPPGVPGVLYGDFTRGELERPVGPLTELSSGVLPGRIYGSFARAGVEPEPEPPSIPSRAGGRALLPEPPRLRPQRPPRRVEVVGEAGVEVGGSGVWAVGVSVLSSGGVEVGAVSSPMDGDSPVSRRRVEVWAEDEELLAMGAL
jgi:hypothetical protein